MAVAVEPPSFSMGSFITWESGLGIFTSWQKVKKKTAKPFKEVKKHFCHLLLVKPGKRTSLDSKRWGENDFTSFLGG
jgi:hypothetical protein